jgi:hypothetical protein
MLRKVYSLFFTFLCKNVSGEKTAPEPELALNPEPELKPNGERELKANSEPEEEVDPIAMLAALPKATSRTHKFNPRLSPIREVLKMQEIKHMLMYHMLSPISHVYHKKLYQIMYEINGLMRYKIKFDCPELN